MRYPNSKPIADLIAQTYCFNSKTNAKMGYRAEEEFVEKNRGLCGSQLRTRRIVFLAITAATKDEKILKIVNIGGKGGRMRLPYSIVAKTDVKRAHTIKKEERSKNGATPPSLYAYNLDDLAGDLFV